MSLTSGESRACSAVGSCALGNCPPRCPSMLQGAGGPGPLLGPGEGIRSSSRTTCHTTQRPGLGGRGLLWVLEQRTFEEVESAIQNVFVYLLWGP